ncbi:MAG: tetratricopeptide repeat protein [Bradymonadaceae bacterium]
MRRRQGPTATLATSILVGLIAVGLSPAAAVAQESGESAGSTAKKKGKEKGEKENEPNIDPYAQIEKANELAGQKKWEEAIPHFEKVMKYKPKKFPSAHFNLANILRAQDEYGRALLHFQIYESLLSSPEEKKSVRKKIRSVVDTIGVENVGTLTVDVTPESRATLSVDGFPAAWNGDLRKFKLMEGEHRIRVEIVDYHPGEATVHVVGGESKKATIKPRMKTFFGKVRVDVDQKDATIKFHPEKVESPKAPSSPVMRTSPMEKPVKLVTGKYLLEVTKPNYHRWVRYIQIQRNKTEKVSVEMEKKLPEEIR